MGSNDGLVYIGYIISKKTDHLCVLTRQTVACCVGNIDHFCPGLYDSLYYPGQIIIICTSGILGIKLHLFNKAASISNGLHSTLEYSIRSGSQLMLYMISRDP